LKPNKKIYFASDFHLGSPSHSKSLEREKKIVQWLDEIKADAEEIILLGDIFDFWFEYKHVVPKGFIRLFAKIASLKESGIKISIFTGNHDIWMFDYLEQELDVVIYRKEEIRDYNGKKFFIAHGDGLGPGDHKFKFVKRFFTSKFCQQLFRWLHPDIGIGLALSWSKHSRNQNIKTGVVNYQGEDKEYLVQFAKEKVKTEQFDYFIFGHRHLMLEIPINEQSTYYNVGDWLSSYSYGVFDGTKFEVKQYDKV
jgi:UDP-2,3-diacylglucosamine hydrolase